MQNSTDSGDIEEAQKVVCKFYLEDKRDDDGKPYVLVEAELTHLSKEIVSALSEARKRERERVREAVEGALNGIGGVKPMEVNGKTEYGFSFGWDAGAKAARSAALKAFDEPV